MLNNNTSISTIIDESQLNEMNVNLNRANNQDPVKQMFTTITKALRTQSIGIRDLSRKCDENLSKHAFENALADISNKYCRKEKVSDINVKLNEKSDQTYVISELDKVNNIKIVFSNSNSQ